MLYNLAQTAEETEREAKRYDLAMRELLKNPFFPLFFMRLLESCKYFTYHVPGTNDINNLLINEGRRAVAAELCQKIDSLAPGASAKMLLEESNRRRANVGGI